MKKTATVVEAMIFGTRQRRRTRQVISRAFAAHRMVVVVCQGERLKVNGRGFPWDGRLEEVSIVNSSESKTVTVRLNVLAGDEVVVS